MTDIRVIRAAEREVSEADATSGMVRDTEGLVILVRVGRGPAVVNVEGPPA